MVSPSSSPGRNPDLLDRQRSQLVVIDVQEKLLPVILDGDAVVKTIRFLMDVACELDVPVVVSEQYPKGLGPTVPEICNHAVSAATFEKLKFSAADGLGEDRTADGRDQFVLTGIETHICVLQTAFDLLGRGHRVYVVADAVGSRDAFDKKTALDRIRDAGGVVCTAESVAFEWCEVSGTETFRAVSKLVRNRAIER